MITEKEIIQILNEWEFGANLKNGEFVRGVKNEYYKDVARAVVSKNESLHDVSGMFPALNTVRQEIEGYKEKTIQGDKGHFQNGINWAFNHISKQIKK